MKNHRGPAAGAVMTLDSIAQEVGLKSETRRSIVALQILRALRKLRWPPDKRYGRDFLANYEWKNAARARRAKRAALFWFFLLVTPSGVSVVQPFATQADCTTAESWVTTSVIPNVPDTYMSQCFNMPSFAAP